MGLLRTWSFQMDLSSDFQLFSIPMMRIFSQVRLFFLRMETDQLQLLNSPTSTPQTSHLSASSVTELPKLSTQEHSWLLPSVVSTTWEERLPDLILQSVTFHVRHQLRYALPF